MMTTLTVLLCFTAVLAVYSTAEEVSFIKRKRGESFDMNCKTDLEVQETFSLYARYPHKDALLEYDKKSSEITLGKKYKERVKTSGSMEKLNVVINALQPSDSGLYLGEYRRFNPEKNLQDVEEGCKVLLFVNDVDPADAHKVSSPESKPAMSEPLILVLALTACTMVVVCFLVMWLFAHKVKALCKKQEDAASRDYNPVYEDMHRVQKK